MDETKIPQPQSQTPPTPQEPQPISTPLPITDAQFTEPHKKAPSISNLMKLGFMALLVLAIPMSFIAVKNSTDNRSKAAEVVMTPPNPTDTPKPTPTCDPRKVGGCGLLTSPSPTGKTVKTSVTGSKLTK